MVLDQPVAAVAHMAKPTTSRVRIGHWTLSIELDPFGGETKCRLQAAAMVYERRVLTFQFATRVDTFEAIYRIDEGPPTSWRVNAMALANEGVALQTDGLTNPSGGWVKVPISLLVDARSIAIRPSSKLPVRVFELDGLSEALASARKAGCGSDFDPKETAVAGP